MTAVRTNFSPTKDGFKFINYFEIKLPRFKIPFAGEVDLNDVVFGLCGGMCFSALDYYYANQPVPTDTDVFKINRKLFTYLADRQLDSIPLANLVRVIDWMLPRAQRFRTADGALRNTQASQAAGQRPTSRDYPDLR